MKISTELPPKNLYERCREKWGVDWDKGLAFAYVDTIYSKYPVSEEIQSHEETHFRQQASLPGGADEWWNRYLADDRFRFEQEIEAFAVQLRWIEKNIPSKELKFKRKNNIYELLSSPMYGSLCTYNEARHLIAKCSVL